MPVGTRIRKHADSSVLRSRGTEPGRDANPAWASQDKHVSESSARSARSRATTMEREAELQLPSPALPRRPEDPPRARVSTNFAVAQLPSRPGALQDLILRALEARHVILQAAGQKTRSNFRALGGRSWWAQHPRCRPCGWPSRVMGGRHVAVPTSSSPPLLGQTLQNQHTLGALPWAHARGHRS